MKSMPGQSKVQTPMLRLLVLNSVCLPNSAGKMEVLLLRSCWVQARARSKAVSWDYRRLLAYRVELERWRP
jgi:hypothetical protein